ncbi:hypothetical protein TRIUR3_33978 [Triticum urartu]|uniref:IST1-like protein n=1 Tax=Triticum urartu TaxID=4572 RepID=M8A2W1_TRIUA|nr:hypothetical protein TRIUR3_33978 [Triticum urartu]
MAKSKSSTKRPAKVNSESPQQQAEQVMEEDSVLEALDIIEHYCKVLVEHSAQLEKPKECGEDIKAAAAGLIFASARCGELPELLDARAILASKFGREFERAAKEGSQAVVNPTLVQRLSGEKASAEQQRRLAREIAAENGILLDFPDGPGEVHQSKQNEQPKKVPAPVPAEKPVEQLEVKTETSEAQRRQRLADDDMSRSNLARQRAEEKASRESKKYDDVRMAAEAAFESASFAAMAARAAVELSRTESQGKGPRGGGRGHDKVHPLQSSGATERETRPPGRPQKPPSPSPSPSWSDKSTVSSVWSDAPARDPPSPPKGKSIVFDRSDGEDDDVVEDLVWTPQLRRPPHNRRTASAMGMDGVGGNGNTRAEFQDSAIIASRNTSSLNYITIHPYFFLNHHTYRLGHSQRDLQGVRKHEDRGESVDASACLKSRKPEEALRASGSSSHTCLAPWSHLKILFARKYSPREAVTTHLYRSTRSRADVAPQGIAVG